jgi:tRNA pseudouridine38-40 synthase
MQPGFHARKSALSRRYLYHIGLDEGSASPFRRHFEWGLGKPLDLDLLRAAAGILRGEHDFRAFAAKTDKPHYRCRVIQAEWARRTGGRGVSLRIEADRFLQRMVRMLVGTMVDIGLGRRPLEDMGVLLRREDNTDTSPPAPPQGLYFAAVVYPPELFADPAGEPHAALHLA